MARMFKLYLQEIESLEFQIQFVVVGGFRLLLSIISELEVVKGLLRELAQDREKAHVIYQRIIHILPKVAKDKELSYDGSIVVYLYCLSERDLSLAFLASMEILNTKGLFWSRRMARAVSKYYRARQIADSIEFTSEEGDPISYTLTGIEYASIENRSQYSYYPGVVESSPDIMPIYEYQRTSNDRVEIQNVSFVPSGGQLVSQHISSPTQEFQIKIAS